MILENFSLKILMRQSRIYVINWMTAHTARSAPNMGMEYARNCTVSELVMASKNLPTIYGTMPFPIAEKIPMMESTIISRRYWLMYFNNTFSPVYRFSLLICSSVSMG